MFILGLVLFLLGLFLGVGILFWLGIVLMVIGAVLFFAPSVTGGRRFY